LLLAGLQESTSSATPLPLQIRILYT